MITQSQPTVGAAPVPERSLSLSKGVEGQPPRDLRRLVIAPTEDKCRLQP